MPGLISVIGMHRSGTSALTGVLVNAGAWFGDPALAAGGRPARPLGLVERKDFLALTEPALMALGHSWHDVYGFRPDWDEPYANGVRERFSAGVLADLLRHRVSVLKDPRLCFLLPLFLPVMPATVGVMIVRNPLEVAMSLAARNGFSIPFGVALWEAYNRQALISLKNVPAILVLHRSLMRSPETMIPETIERLTALGVEGLDGQAALSSESIDRRLFHQHAKEAEGHGLAPGQRLFWRQLREAKSPAQLPESELSPDSAEILREHHLELAARPPGRARRAPASRG